MRKLYRRAGVLVLTMLCVTPALAITRYVGPDGTGDGTSPGTPMGFFEDALMELGPGDTLVVLEGDYAEDLIIDVDLTVLFQGPGATTIDSLDLEGVCTIETAGTLNVVLGDFSMPGGTLSALARKFGDVC